MDGTVILDESFLAEEESHGFKIKIDEQEEEKIALNVKRGWEEGEYVVGNLKATIDKLCREVHGKFLSDCQ